MATKIGVSSAAKPNKATMPGAPRMPHTATISATQAPIALTAVAAIATGCEGAEGGAEERAAPSGVQQLSAEVWATMSGKAKNSYLRNHKAGQRKQGGK